MRRKHRKRPDARPIGLSLGSPDDQVEADLRAGLARAATEGRWDAVAILNEQLRAHVEAKAGNVIPFSRRGEKGS